MALVFHERVGLEGRRISPFSWRIRYALAHKGLAAEVIPTGFADVDRILAKSHQRFVPIIEHDGSVVHDSWAIACHLEDRFPDRPSLFSGEIGLGATRLLNHWADSMLGALLRRQIYADFIWVIAPEDRAYFRQSREALLGMTLEAYSATRDEALAEFTASCGPLERTLSEQAFIAGTTPAYADYAVFSLFQWARIGSPRDVLADRLPAIRAWRARMVALFNHLGDRFPSYPSERSGPDGSAAQQPSP